MGRQLLTRGSCRLIAKKRKKGGQIYFSGTDALIDAALADQDFIYVLDVFVSRLLPQG